MNMGVVLDVVAVGWLVAAINYLSSLSHFIHSFKPRPNRIQPSFGV